MRGLRITGGLLLGRPVLSRSRYEYVVLPPVSSAIDILRAGGGVALDDMLIINTKMFRAFLRYPYRVTGFAYPKPTPQGPMYFIRIENKEPVPIEPERVEQSFHVVDRGAKFHTLSVDRIDARFLASLATYTEVHSSARLLSTPVIVPVEGVPEAKTVMVNIAEAWMLMKSEPSLLRGLVVLPEYQLVALVLDTIPVDILIDEIADKIIESTDAFQRDYMRTTYFLSEDQED